MLQYQPCISRSTAALLSVLFTVIYVAPFYLSAETRPSPTLSRDAPAVIRARIRAVTFSCVVTSTITACVALQYAELSPRHVLHLLGWWPIPFLSTCGSVVWVAILFAGPLFENGIIEGRWRAWLRGEGLSEAFSSTIGWRTYIASPITEEILFRSTIVSIHLLTKDFSPTSLVFLTPLYFGLAHIHHAYEFHLTYPKVPFLPVIIRTLVQFTYTSVFGFIAAFLYLRTGSLVPCILTHAFCNWMGLPRFWGRVEGPPGLFWTIAYYAVLVMGALGFYFSVWSLTKSENALIAF